MLTTCGRNWIAQQQRHQLQRPRHWLIRYIMTELNAYTSEPTINRSQCPLGWWLANKNKYPVVAAVARQMLSVLATSVASERFFLILMGWKVRQPIPSCVVTKLRHLFPITPEEDADYVGFHEADSD